MNWGRLLQPAKSAKNSFLVGRFVTETQLKKFQNGADK
jgi:hypothetical protein